MENYNYKILELLKGETEKEKYEFLKNEIQNNLSVNELMSISLYCMKDDRRKDAKFNKKYIKEIGMKLFKSVSPEFVRIFGTK